MSNELTLDRVKAAACGMSKHANAARVYHSGNVFVVRGVGFVSRRMIANMETELGVPLDWETEVDAYDPTSLTLLVWQRQEPALHTDAFVAEFHKAFDYPVRTVPTVPDQGEQVLRLRLIAEEFFELLEAHGIFAAANDTESLRDLVMREIDDLAAWQWNEQPRLPDVAKELADLDYVIAGTRLTYGIPGRAVFDAVHRSNMAKAGGTHDAHGKLQKPAGWRPPDIAGILRRAGWKE